MRARIIVYVALAVAILFLPWWLTLGISVITALLVGTFYELALVGIVSDLLYQSDGLYVVVPHVSMTLIYVCLTVTIEFFVRSHIRTGLV